MKPEHKQKIDELISELSSYKTREANFIAAVLCVLQASIIIGDMEDFCHWVDFYNKQILDRILTKGGKDEKGQEKVHN